MSIVTVAMNRWLKSPSASAVARATRAVIEPLETRTMLNAAVAMLPGGLPSYWSMIGGASQHVAHHQHHNDRMAAGGNLLAHPTLDLSGGPSGQGASALEVSNPTPIGGALSPSQVQQAYGFSNIVLPNGSPATGAGETIGIVDAFDDPNIQSDLHTFDQQYFGGVDPNFTKVNLGATNTTSSPEQWEAEESLDVEWAHAIAPQANIMLVEGATNSMNDLLAAVDKAIALGANVVSMSWGLNGAESSSETTWDTHFQVPNVAFVASSDDVGSPGSWPAASPYVVGVGGTSLALDANNNWSSEVGWYDSGGGISTYESRLASQPATYNNGSTTGIPLTNRGIPDVAYDSAEESAMSIYDSFSHTSSHVFSGTQTGWIREWGTSAGAPQWAALIALADQGRAQTGLTPLGTGAVLSTLYANPGDFHDIVSGTSTGTPNYTAGPGYDLVTGLGSPQAPLVVSSLIGIAPTTTPASPIGFSATPADGQISLAWNASSGASSWNVYRSTDGVNYSIYATVAGTSFMDGGLSDGSNYWYEVTAVNSIGESASSAAVSATPQTPPASPILQLATPSNNTFSIPDCSYAVSLQWSASPRAATYTVLRSNTSGSGYAVVAGRISATSYLDTSAYAGTRYYYVIQAVSSSGAASPDSNELSAMTIPPPPSGLLAIAGDKRVSLSWSAALGASSYNILRSTTSGGGYVVAASGVTGNTFTVTGLTDGTTYYFVVQAVNASGPSANSNQVSATPKHGK